MYMQYIDKLYTKVMRQYLSVKVLFADTVCLNIGAGGSRYQGWISTEKNQLDVTNPEHFAFLFSRKKISKILAEHVIEHIHENEFIEFLHFVKAYLEPMATIRIAVPDANHPSIYVRDLTKPGGEEPGADDHKVFYSIDRMRYIASKTFYKLDPIEYFDDKGFFHFNNISWDNGYICRSLTQYNGRFTVSKIERDKMFETIPAHLRNQFTSLNMTYTSLIVDFINT